MNPIETIAHKGHIIVRLPGDLIGYGDGDAHCVMPLTLANLQGLFAAIDDGGDLSVAALRRHGVIWNAAVGV